MTDSVAVRGVVASAPRHVITETGLPITSFRLVTRRRRYDREKRVWEDADGNWYTVSAFRRLAVGAAEALVKGDRVIVAGRLCIREWKVSSAVSPQRSRRRGSGTTSPGAARPRRAAAGTHPRCRRPLHGRPSATSL